MGSDEAKKIGSKKRILTGFWQWLLIAFSAMTVVVVINQIFHLDLFGAALGLESSFLYILLGLYGSLTFLIYPIRSGEKYRRGFYFGLDFILCLVTLFICLVFAYKALAMILEGWAMIAPMPYPVLGIILWILVLEATRRSQGLVMTSIVVLASFFPLYTEYMPGFLTGIGFNFTQTISYHAFSINSLVGLPMRVVCNIVIGFIIFGIVLMTSGGGAFFMDFALSLLGSSRGGAAKVSVVASAFFGSMSGSVASNVITTGSMTMPTMVKTGYPRHFAAAVEACSSTASVLVPPVMGATAFIMADFLNMPYLTIATCAVIPSLLYYTGLLIQVDAHAARNNLRGLLAEEIPSLKNTLKKGWFYIGALFVLIFFLFLRMQHQAPYYATVFLLICANFRKETRFNLVKIKNLFISNIQVLTGLIVLVSAIGMIIGSLTVTGVAHAMSREIIYFAGNSVILMVLLGAFASFVLGMGVTITACYVILAVTLAPPLIQMGLDPLAVNLFLMYCGMISFITLPVAIAVYIAAEFIGANSINTGITAMRLGIVTYIVPFFFVFNPALILRGPILEVMICTSLALLGVVILASALGGYAVGFGTLTIGKRKKLANFVLRPALFISGLLLGTPERFTDLLGLMMAIVIMIFFYFQKKSKRQCNEI